MNTQPTAMASRAMKPAASSGNLMALPDGHELVGDFRIKRVIGAGGFGITYLALDLVSVALIPITVAKEI